MWEVDTGGGEGARWGFNPLNLSPVDNSTLGKEGRQPIEFGGRKEPFSMCHSRVEIYLGSQSNDGLIMWEVGGVGVRVGVGRRVRLLW